MTPEDVLYRHRLRTLALAEELGSVRAACRVMGIHHSTFYRWKNQATRYGLEILRPRERRPPRLSNATSPVVEQRVVAFALGNPGFGPARIAAELARAGTAAAGVARGAGGTDAVPSVRGGAIAVGAGGATGDTAGACSGVSPPPRQAESQTTEASETLPTRRNPAAACGVVPRGITDRRRAGRGRADLLPPRSLLRVVRRQNVRVTRHPLVDHPRAGSADGRAAIGRAGLFYRIYAVVVYRYVTTVRRGRRRSR